MIISKTPFRISFFGGGTDYPVWYENNGGAVLSTTIDKYCYLTCRYLPPFFDHKYRIVYSHVEIARDVDQIKHPVVRASLYFANIKKGVEIHHDGDLPARTGLGSSSSFTVGLLNSLYALKGTMPTKNRLAKEAIHIERYVLKEHVGSQDQVAVAYGGMNKISFKQDGEFTVEPVTVGRSRLDDLQNHLMLYFTGFSRIASKVAKKQVQNTHKKYNELTLMRAMVDEAVDILSNGRNIEEFGKLLHESWMLKRSLTDAITNNHIDDIYATAMAAGAIGGKLLGAGGGGFMVFFVKPEVQAKVRHKLNKLLEVNFHFDTSGSQIIFYTDEAKAD